MNREVFERVQQEIGFLEDKLTHLENSLIDSFSLATENQLLQCRNQYAAWLEREEILWRQKSRIKWLQEGDGNTKFFHASVENKKKNHILEHMVLEDGTVLKSVDDIHEGAVQFFKELLSVSPISMDDNNLSLLTPAITMEENLSLCKPPELEEVKDALWSIPKDSGPGPNGFSASFFITAWDIVKDDLLAVAT